MILKKSVYFSDKKHGSEEVKNGFSNFRKNLILDILKLHYIQST